jgi:phosphatidylinositol alpha-1,6-mannosyltransferase
MRETPGEAGEDPCSYSKPAAALRALRVRGRAERVLFWHMDLLRLLPLLGCRRAKVYVALHGIECWRPPDSAIERLLSRVDVFLTFSDFTWTRFIEMNPRWKHSRHRTVALGLGSPAGTVLPQAARPAAIIVGRMYRSENYKGHRELIEAWPAVLRRLSDAELWVVGGGDSANDFKQLAAGLGVARRIRFFGAVLASEKERLLQSARCLVMPSRAEGFGLTYLEEMRFGRPCLTSTQDAGREVVNPPEAGLAVDPSNTEALADALVRLMTPGPEWEEWSRRAKHRYEAGFTEAHFQERLLNAVLDQEAV